MQFNTYTGAGAHVAVWLVNHPEPDAAALAAELRRRDVHEPAVTAAAAAALTPWTTRLRAVFAATAVTDKALLTDALLVTAGSWTSWRRSSAARAAAPGSGWLTSQTAMCAPATV